jgi:pyridoxine 5-phosphate synthase
MSEKMSDKLRLGVNIDHVATIRNARGGLHPDPVRAALLAQEAGADGITLHVREDRRHVREEDLERLAQAISLPINLEMACTDDMLAIALAAKPHAACLVPERREERTTEGGLDVAGSHNAVAPVVRALADAKIRVSLFIDPDPVQIAVAEAIGAAVVELHTGEFCHAFDANDAKAMDRTLGALRDSAAEAQRRGLEAHAGHGITFGSVLPVAAIPELRELNIGHFLVGEAIFIGFPESIRRMRALMDQARNGPGGQA